MVRYWELGVKVEGVGLGLARASKCHLDHRVRNPR